MKLEYSKKNVFRLIYDHPFTWVVGFMKYQFLKLLITFLANIYWIDMKLNDFHWKPFLS